MRTRLWLLLFAIMQFSCDGKAIQPTRWSRREASLSWRGRPKDRRSEHGKGQRDQAIIPDTKHVCLLIRKYVALLQIRRTKPRSVALLLRTSSKTRSIPIKGISPATIIIGSNACVAIV